MKKQNLLFVALSASALLSLGVSSCQKKEIEAIPPSSNSKVTTFGGAATLLRNLDIAETAIYLYPDDQNYEKIDMGRYALGKAIKDLITPNMLQSLVTYVNNNHIQSISFDQIFTLYPTLKTVVNNKLQTQQLALCPYDFTSYDKINAVMSREGISYNPELYLYNLSKNPDLQSFVLSPGLELNDEDSTHEDQVMAWHKPSPSSSLQPVKITESEANLFGGIFLTISLRPQGGVVTGGGPTPIPPAPSGPIKNICMRSLNIHYRYEKSGKSEVYAHAINLDGNTWLGTFSKLWPANDYSKHLTSTKKTNQWVTVDKGQTLFSSTKSAVWNTFERDWWESFKPIDNQGGSTTLLFSGVPMTFATEWYALTPGNNNLNNPKSLQNGNAFKSQNILVNGFNDTYMQGENNKFEAKFYAQ